MAAAPAGSFTIPHLDGVRRTPGQLVAVDPDRRLGEHLPVVVIARVQPAGPRGSRPRQSLAQSEH